MDYVSTPRCKFCYRSTYGTLPSKGGEEVDDLWMTE